jgi:CheY-like chemotaxis protein
VINGYSDLLLQTLPANDPSRELIEEISKAGHRAGGLTRQLLAFSRRQVLAPTIVDVNDVVRDTERMLRRVIGEDITLATALDARLGAVRIDRGQLEQTLLNLAVNARDAMPLGGRLTIETLMVELPEDHPSGARPGWRRHVCLTVTDTGTGMSEDVRSRLFEPFFTTKAPGKGTGLGLAVVHGFVKQSGGEVEVHSGVGDGTRFRIFLPCVTPRTGSCEVEYARQLPCGRGTILLVEDDDGVRELTRRILEQCGFTVIQASRPDQALRAVEHHSVPIDLLVTDVVMPASSGRVLAEQLRERHSLLKVLYMSGYTDDAVVRHGVLHEHVGFIQKPFTPAAMAEKVCEALGSRPPR